MRAAGEVEEAQHHVDLAVAAPALEDHGCLAIADPLEVEIDCAAVLDAVGRTVDAARLRARTGDDPQVGRIHHLPRPSDPVPRGGLLARQAL